MPSRDWRFRLENIPESIAAIQEYVQTVDFTAFAGDQKLIDAVVYRFTIIGEAANHVPREIAEAHPSIPWRKMREMRNVLVHAYFGVSKQIVWQTIQEDLPPLVPLLRQLLEGS